MLSATSRRLGPLAAQMRGIATASPCLAEGEGAAVDTGAKAFTDRFRKHVSSTLASPHYPTDFMKKKEFKEGEPVPEKMKINFFLPHEQILKQAEVDLALLPAVTGDFGVMPGHVPTVAQLRPGVLTVHKELDKSIDKYFISSGFAFVHADSSTDVCAIEAVKLDDLDADAVRSGLSDYTSKLSAAQGRGDDYESAVAQIGVEVFSALNAAVTA